MPVLALVVVCAVGVLVLFVSTARAATAVPGVDVPFKTVIATRFTRRSLGSQYARGKRIAARFIVGPRVFTDAMHGFALADPVGAQYPAVTSDGGRTWRIAGPYLHVNAADGADDVSMIGAASSKLLFAGTSFGVDATPDGGKHWYQSYLGTGGLLGVTWNGFELHAYVQPNRTHGPLPTWTYVSKDGLHWRYTASLGGL